MRNIIIQTQKDYTVSIRITVTA